jgi:hypothetical protein
MKLLYMRGNTSLLIEAQIDYLSKKYGEQVDQELIQHAIKIASKHGDLGVAEKLLFGYTNDIIDEISPENIEQIKGLDPNKKAPKSETTLADILLSKRSRWEGKAAYSPGSMARSPSRIQSGEAINDYIESLRAYDPTGEQGEYLKYIVKQLAVNNVRLPEDGGRIHQALEFFHNSKNTQQWKDLELPVDLMNKKSPINNWRELEEIYHKLNPEEGEAIDFTSKRQKARGIKEGYKLVAEVEIPNKYKTLYSIYKVMEPGAAQFLGKGTRWCTTWLNDNVEMLPPEATEYTGEPNPDYGPGRSQRQMEPPYTFTYADWHPKAGETGEYQWMRGPKTGEGAGKEGFPLQAQIHYLQHNPLYIVFRKHQEGDPGPPKKGDKHDIPGGSGQILQIGSGEYGVEMKNVNDQSLGVTVRPSDDETAGRVDVGTDSDDALPVSPSLDYALAKWSESDPDAPQDWILRIRKMCRMPNYPERPPLYESPGGFAR